MATDTQPSAATPAPDPYLDLVRAFPLRPIRSDDDHKRAIAAIDALADRRDGWGADEDDYFLVLALLIERYEDEIYGEGSGAASPADAGAELRPS
jgi:HTH-type transcriptional regulator/antitoxin HigA